MQPNHRPRMTLSGRSSQPIHQASMHTTPPSARSAPPSLPRHPSALAPLLLAATLAGCAAVGPDYRAPGPAVPAGWHTGLQGGLHSADADADAAARTRWWRRFDDATLSTLVETALAANRDLHGAQAALRGARARRIVAGTAFYPTVGTTLSGRRTTPSLSAAGPALYAAGFDASWEPDVFGGKRRAAEAAQADLERSAATLAATQTSLAAEVALNYVALRGYQTRLAIARSNLASQSETLQLTEWRTQAGLVGSLQLEQARANREQTRAQIPALETSLAQARNRLAVLTGRAPGAVDAQLAVATGIPAMPATLAVGIPADTLRRRPDVRAAERLLAAETARVGQAQAARYPDFSLSGSIGLDAFTPGTLASGTVNRSLAASVAATIFDGGRLRQQVAVQDAVREQALYAYQAAVLTALEDVENALVAFARSKERQAALDAAATAARQAAQLASQQYASGIIDFQTVLDTQRSVLALQDALAAAQADGATAVVQLYKALGGGWEPAAAPPISNDTTASHPP